jgi:hypothetical protein
MDVDARGLENWEPFTRHHVAPEGSFSGGASFGSGGGGGGASGRPVTAEASLVSMSSSMRQQLDQR